MASPRIVWLRRDLRLCDQPALHAAAAAGPVIAVYVLDERRPGDRRPGGASRWWLHHALAALRTDLAQRGSRLILRRGDCVEQLVQIAAETGAAAIHAVRHYEPWWRRAEADLAARATLCLHDGNYLAPPGAVTTGAGEPYRIYTPFMKALMRLMPPRDPFPVPELAAPDRWPRSDRLEEWHLLPTRPDWAAGFAGHWQAGEAAARAALADFRARVGAYETDRNLPSVDGSSRLSPHLHWGALSPGQVWHALAEARGDGGDAFRRELIWRDFAQTVIFAFPDYAEAPHRARFARLGWRDPASDPAAAADLAAWQQGRTGYPIVDAGMRQLWRIGWMHNRVRMIAASFLVKHLLIDWRCGERWFWDTLVDADYANNAVNWQWVSGSGVDAQLFTRIMAPLSQSAKFAAAGYIRRWVPELAALSDAEIHDPPEGRRPRAYPPMLIGHRAARERALGAWRRL
ncbi:MAG: deoxyribodipyrimidine photo-lyase [Porphyrobacter sp.]|nr:deoxyribodipyrimidine photo-lyase [Porphyrobacter sp.]